MTHDAPTLHNFSVERVPPFEAIRYLRTLLYVGPPDVVSDAMAAAIEREFPSLCVKNVRDLKAALCEFEIPLRLLLVDLELANSLNSCAGELLKQHPSIAVVIVTEGDQRESAGRLHFIDTRLVRGVLPLNVSLDVLLSILRIILKGGTYFPSATYGIQEGALREAGSPRSPDSPAETILRLAHEVRAKTMHQLTKRENEILARIALGNQNKIIAAALGLSEHTVKIHIHNIITKLGVHNRTEAVAMYFEHEETDGGEALPGDSVHSGSGSVPGGDA
jgi:DNA-binding NarL/FixJ family response regulator